MAKRTENEFLSASEDGTVRLWDIRSQDTAHIIRVCDEPQLTRNNCGKGVCALDANSSFMVLMIVILYSYNY